MAIDPKLVSIKQASDLTTAIPTNDGFFFYYENGDLKKAPMTDIYNKVNGAFGGDLVVADVPAPNVPTWYFAKESGTYTNAGGLVVDTTGNVVILNYDGTTWSMLETASVEGKSAYEVAVDNGFIGTEAEWLASLGADKLKMELENTSIWLDYNVVNLGEYVMLTNGTLAGDAALNATDYIDISNLEFVTINAVTTPLGLVGNAFYSDKNEGSFISAWSEVGSRGYKKVSVKRPANANYLRASTWNKVIEPGKSVVGEFYALGNAFVHQGQLSEVKQELAKLADSSVFLEPKVNNILKYINPANGVMYNSVNLNATDYIDISNLEFVTVNAVTTEAAEAGNAFYSEKNESSFISAFAEEGTYGYRKVTVKKPSNAKYFRSSVWNKSSALGQSIKGEFFVLGDNFLPGTSSTIYLPKTSYIATARNFILKEELVSGVSTLLHSNDLGKSWKSLPSVGDISFVHWFMDGTCLIATPTKVYYTKDWTGLNESALIDYNGSVYVPTLRPFFALFHHNSRVIKINGVETLIWPEYGGPIGYVARIWMSQDNGQTVKCICKSGETLASGQTLSIRHFHDCIWDEYENCLWIATGDAAAECHLMKGVFNGTTWTYTIMATGPDFKFSQIFHDEINLYLVSDFTEFTTPTGLMCVAKDRANDQAAYFYIYKDETKTPYSFFFSDQNGHNVLMFDGATVNKLKYAYKDFDMVEKKVVFEDATYLSVGTTYGPNYNGDVISIAFSGYDITAMKMNNPNRFLLSEGMRNAGFKDFGKSILKPPFNY